jgi:glycosyltransferase involved in cell wall biosynthesis
MKGGVGRYTSHLVNALNERGGIEVHVALGSQNPLTSISYSDHTFNIPKQTSYIEELGTRHCGIIKKGDRRNSDRLLSLVQELKPDVVNIQYERGLYEVDTSVVPMAQRMLFGSTLHKFFSECPVPTISTLHTVLPHDEYQDYIKERALRKEGKFGFLPPQVRSVMRRWVLQRRYELLFEVVHISNEIIGLAKTIQKIVRRGAIIYHGAEPASYLLSRRNQQEFRKEFGLPDDKRLLLAFGHVGSYKGFDILDGLKLPRDWNVVVKQNVHERGTEQPVPLNNNAISLDYEYLNDIKLSKLFFACDAIILPYRVVSVSGVLFDAMAHGLPFIGSNLRFFREFSSMKLGITCDRSVSSMSKSISLLDADFDIYRKNVECFSPKLRWATVADHHIDLYAKIN